MERISLPQIRVLDAVATEKNFSRAAARLGITQPAVSTHLRDLQKRYGINIYFRRGNKILLTPLGNELANSGRKVLGLLERMDHQIRDAAHLKAGKIKIGLSCHYFVTKLLPKFIKVYPGIKIKANIGHSGKLKEEVLSCQLDVAEVTAIEPDPLLYNLKFSEQRILLFVSQDHPWAGQPCINMEQLNGEKMVALSNKSMTRQIFNMNLDGKGVRPDIVLELDNWETMKETVMAGVGFGIALEDEFGPDDRLVKIPIKGASFKANQYFVCLPEYRELNVVSAFLDIAKKEGEKYRILKQIEKMNSKEKKNEKTG
ncbi:MAG: LysR substrate-binding domain-containing protein [Desulfobacterales bacterium]|nr:LysR substrate-binding domain-containing protein [Desulfobacterales bacterium]